MVHEIPPPRSSPAPPLNLSNNAAYRRGTDLRGLRGIFNHELTLKKWNISGSFILSHSHIPLGTTADCPTANRRFQFPWGQLPTAPLRTDVFSSLGDNCRLPHCEQMLSVPLGTTADCPTANRRLQNFLHPQTLNDAVKTFFLCSQARATIILHTRPPCIRNQCRTNAGCRPNGTAWPA